MMTCHGVPLYQRPAVAKCAVLAVSLDHLRLQIPSIVDHGKYEDILLFDFVEDAVTKGSSPFL